MAENIEEGCIVSSELVKFDEKAITNIMNLFKKDGFSYLDIDLDELQAKFNQFKDRELDKGTLKIIDNIMKAFVKKSVAQERITELGDAFFNKALLQNGSKPTALELIDFIQNRLINRNPNKGGGNTIENMIDIAHNKSAIAFGNKIESIFTKLKPKDLQDMKLKYGVSNPKSLVIAMDKINLEGGMPKTSKAKAIYQLNLDLLTPVKNDNDDVLTTRLKALVNSSRNGINNKSQNVSLARLDNAYISQRNSFNISKRWSVDSRNTFAKDYISKSNDIDWDMTMKQYAVVNQLDPSTLTKRGIIERVVESLTLGNAEKVIDDVTPYLIPIKGKEKDMYEAFGDVSVLTNTLNKQMSQVKKFVSDTEFGGDLEAFVESVMRAGKYTEKELTTKEVKKRLDSNLFGLNGTIATFTGKLSTAKNSLSARSFANFRTAISASIQGTYTVSALFGDPSTMFMNYRNLGDSIPMAVKRTLMNKELGTIANFARGYGKTHNKDYAATAKALNIVLSKNILGYRSTRYKSGSKSQAMLRFESDMNSWTGLTFLTEVRQVQAAKAVNDIIIGNSKTKYTALPIKFKEKLDLYGITANDWATIESIKVNDGIMDINSSGDLAAKLSTLIAGENTNAVIVVGRQTEQLAKAGTVLGTTSGETLAMVTQLKLHPITMGLKMYRDIFSARNLAISHSSRVLSKYVKGLSPIQAEKFLRALELFTVLTVSGFLRTYAGEIEKWVTGEPMDFSDPATTDMFLKAVTYGGFGTVAPDIYKFITTGNVAVLSVGVSRGIVGAYKTSNALSNLMVGLGKGDEVTIANEVGKLIPADIYILSAVVKNLNNSVMEELFPREYRKYIRNKERWIRKERREANK